MIKQLQEFPPVWEYSAYASTDKVGLFIPCFVDHFFPSVAKATVEILNRAGVPFVYPTEQTCCGMPSFNSGYWEQARCVSEKLARDFQDFDWIVCPSGACASMGRVSFRALEQSPGTLSNVGSRMVELSEFLVEVLKIDDLGASFPHTVTMHNGCHGRRELGLGPQAKKLLDKVSGLEYIELPDAEDCCGFGGTFSVKVPHLSVDMGETKVKNILSTGAEYLTSIDSSCLMHINGVLKKHPESQITPIHLSEILISHE